MQRTLFTALLLLVASCKATENAPPPAPGESKVEVVRMHNTPDGAIVTERVNEREPAEPGEPHELVITAVGSPHPAQEPRGGPGPMLAPRPPEGPPEVEPGRKLSVDWRGDGLQDGEVLDVRGHWVKLRFVTIERGPDPNTTIGAAVIAWVDFSKVGYYIPGPIEKRKAKRKAAAEVLPPKPRGEIQ